MNSVQIWDPRPHLWAEVRRLILEKYRTDAEAYRKKRAARRARQAEEQERRAREANAETLAAEAAIRERIRALTIQFGPFDIYEDESHLEDYAKKNMTTLLATREEIMTAYIELHADQSFMIRLKADAPQVYTRAIFQARALARAERLAAQPPPPRKKLTPEEFRAFLVRREEVKAADERAKARVKIENMLKAREDLAQYDLDPDERQQLENELIDKILEQSEVSHGAPNKETL